MADKPKTRPDEPTLTIEKVEFKRVQRPPHTGAKPHSTVHKVPPSEKE